MFFLKAGEILYNVGGKSMCVISVIVPIYNAEEYLSKCISSILVQSLTDFELILVDDGSNDSSGSICNQYKEKDSRIRVIQQKNAGLSAARNVGIEVSEGKFIAFIDSDDFIHPLMLEILYYNMIETGADISVCDYHLVYEGKNVPLGFNDNKIITYSNIEAVKKIAKNSETMMIVAWCKLYRRSLFCDIRYPVGKYHEDEFVTYKLLYKSNKVVVSGAKLYYYLQRSSSITGSTYSAKRLEKLEALKEAAIFFNEEENNELTYLAKFRLLLNIQIAYYRVKYEMNQNKEIMNNLRKDYIENIREFEREGIKIISATKRMQLRLFYAFPDIYCGLVKLILLCIPQKHHKLSLNYFAYKILGRIRRS